MRAALYARVSTDKQVEKYGISSQIEGLKKRCLEKGLTWLPDGVREAFVDDGYSGSELGRPALNRLREAVVKDDVDVVMAYDPDRLSRSLSHLLLLGDEFTRRGVRLEFITQEMDTSPEGKMFFAIRGAVGQYEREKIRERSMRGLREKARQGKVLGGSCAPYGYCYNKETATLEEDPEKAKVMRFIFHIFANENLSLIGLASRLNRLDIPTPGGGDRWRASSLSFMLKNETYAGRLHQFCRYKVEPKFRLQQITKKKKTAVATRPREEWVTATVPALVTTELFEAVQRKLSRNAALASRNTKREYLLSGLLFCAQCGGRMGGHNSHGVSYYRCYHKDRPDTIPLNSDGQPVPCQCHEIRAKIIEPEVWETVAGLIRNPENLLEELHRRSNADSETKEMLERELQICQSRLKSIPVEQRRLVEGYRKGLYPDFMMREEMESIGKDQKELESRVVQLERQLSQKELTANQEIRIKEFVERLTIGLDNLDFHGKQEILRLLAEKVIYYGSNIEIQTIIRPDAQLHPIPRGGLRG